ncbi:MAG: hypothetical protein D6689_01905 [Deltaproteobacteria bacterium]|nr:MAG: hypothetical protein D6689_01905 [Deltaproteobacteria bacterium]
MVWWLWLALSAAPPGCGPAAERARLVGHAVVDAPGGGYVIADVAGEGRPIVGVVERRDGALWVAGHALTGPLARPRIAGPGYKVWVLGAVEGRRLRARRIGVLAPPRCGHAAGDVGRRPRSP